MEVEVTTGGEVVVVVTSGEVVSRRRTEALSSSSDERRRRFPEGHPRVPNKGMKTTKRVRNTRTPRAISAEQQENSTVVSRRLSGGFPGWRGVMLRLRSDTDTGNSRDGETDARNSPFCGKKERDGKRKDNGK